MDIADVYSQALLCVENHLIIILAYQSLAQATIAKYASSQPRLVHKHPLLPCGKPLYDDGAILVLPQCNMSSQL